MGEPLVIFRSVNRDGETFALAPQTLARLREHFAGEVHIRSRVFISHETREDYESVHCGIVPQVLQLLTGISEQRLRELGELRFLDPATETVVPVRDRTSRASVESSPGQR